MRVEWRHDDDAAPAYIYGEYDAANEELRKVERYLDGRMHYADRVVGTGDACLADLPAPSIDEINADPQLHAEEITRDSFETVWIAALASPPSA